MRDSMPSIIQMCNAWERSYWVVCSLAAWASPSMQREKHQLNVRLADSISPEPGVMKGSAPTKNCVPSGSSGSAGTFMTLGSAAGIAARQFFYATSKWLSVLHIWLHLEREKFMMAAFMWKTID